jgi:acyl-CoA dehydrogenase
MPMNVQSIASLPDKVNQIRLLTAKIVNEEILPNENQLWRYRRDGGVSDVEKAKSHNLRHSIQEKVKEAGLWAPHLPEEYGGCGLTFLEHAYMNEVLAYAIGAASLFGVVAPNSGNQKILLKYGTEAQRKKWLVPLTEGKMQSAFSMTEPDSAGSDPRSIKTTATRDGDDWVINGHKWFTSNGIGSDFLIVMCRTDDPTGPAERNGKMTQIIVPTDTPGVNIVRGIEVWGRSGDHAEIIYDNVRVPAENQLGQTGSGHQAAQDRLGAGRVFHCMNSVGQMWRAFDLMIERATTREVHRGLLQDKKKKNGVNSDSYIDKQTPPQITIK